MFSIRSSILTGLRRSQENLGGPLRTVALWAVSLLLELIYQGTDKRNDVENDLRCAVWKPDGHVDPSVTCIIHTVGAVE